MTETLLELLSEIPPDSEGEEDLPVEGNPPTEGSPEADANKGDNPLKAKLDQAMELLQQQEVELRRLAAAKPVADYIDQDPSVINDLNKLIDDRLKRENAPDSEPFKFKGLPDPETTDPDEYVKQSVGAIAEAVQHLLSRENETQKEKAQREEIARRQEAYRQHVQKTALALKENHGFNDSEIREYLQFVGDPRAFSTENLVRFWRSLNPADPVPPEQQPNPSLQDLQPGLADVGGTPDETASDDQLFEDAMLNWKP